MIRKEEIFEILRFIREQRIYSGDVYRIIGFENPPIQQFDFLLWNRSCQREVGVEIKELHEIYGDGVSHVGHVQNFERKIKPELDKLIQAEKGNSQPIVFVEMSNINLLSKTPAKVKAEQLYSGLKRKNKIRKGDTPGPPIYLPGSGVHDISPRLGDGLRRCIVKAAEQLSNESNMFKYLIVVSRYIFATPEEVRGIVGRIIEEEAVGDKIDRVYLSNAGAVTAYGDGKIFERTEQVYPAA